MTHGKLPGATAIAVALLSLAGVAGAETCLEKATALKAQVDEWPPTNSSRADLSASLGVALGADEKRCEEILARVQQDVEIESAGHASGDKAIPNYPNQPAAPSTGPGVDDSAMGAGSEEGHASENDPIPNQETGDAPSPSGPGVTGTASDPASGTETSGHASEDDPIPNQAAGADDTED